MGTPYQRAAELAAFLGNTLHESDEFRAGREYLMCADHKVVNDLVYCKPCDSGSFDWATFTCPTSLVSGNSAFNEYCQPSSKPPEACSCGNGQGQSGDLEGYVPASDLYFGRGAIQLSWNYNYIGASVALTGSAETFCKDPDLVATEGRYAWGAGVYFWMEHVKEGSTCHTESLGMDFGGTLNNVSHCPVECWEQEVKVLCTCSFSRLYSSLYCFFSPDQRRTRMPRSRRLARRSRQNAPQPLLSCRQGIGPTQPHDAFAMCRSRRENDGLSRRWELFRLSRLCWDEGGGDSGQLFSASVYRCGECCR